MEGGVAHVPLVMDGTGYDLHDMNGGGNGFLWNNKKEIILSIKAFQTFQKLTSIELVLCICLAHISSEDYSWAMN